MGAEWEKTYKANKTMDMLGKLGLGDLYPVAKDSPEGVKISELVDGLGLPENNDNIMLANLAYLLGREDGRGNFAGDDQEYNNGFAMMADSYQKAAGEGKINKEQAEKKARVYNFLATCDTDDLYTLFDSTAFNGVARGYMRAAVKHLIANKTIDEEQGAAVRNEYTILFSEKTAKEISEG